MSKKLTTQKNSVATSKEHGSGGVLQGHCRGLMDLNWNSEMGLLLGFSVLGATVGFGQRRLDKIDSVREACDVPVVVFAGSALGARDGGCEVMTAGAIDGGIAVKRGVEIEGCWWPGFGRKTKSVPAINSPLSHLLSTSMMELDGFGGSGAVHPGRMQNSGLGGNDTASRSLHQPLRPQIRQSGTTIFGSTARRRRGADQLDAGTQRVAKIGAAAGRKLGRQSKGLNTGLCQVGAKRGADSTHTKRGLNGQGFVR